MNAAALVYGDANRRRKPVRLALLFVWIAAVSVLAWNHAVWRDEVRAYSFALQGHNVFAMLKGLHGEGHPALWYLLIRGGHALVAHPEVLPVIAFAVAFAAILLLVLRSPFSLPALALMLSSHFALYEYSVMARNYGISMLLLFVIAAAYRSHRDRGLVVGALLFLLANTNAHSVLLVGAFLVFWLLDLVANKAECRPNSLRNFFVNAVIASLGVVLCAATVYPTINQAARMTPSGGITLPFLLGTLLPSVSFSQTVLLDIFHPAMVHLSLVNPMFSAAIIFATSALLFGSTLGLVRRPAALISSWIALVGLTLMFAVVYPGYYRHQALWLVFLIALYWIAGRGRSTASQEPTRLIRAVESSGYAMFTVLLLLQSIAGIYTVTPLILHRASEGRARDLAKLISTTPSLQDSIVLGDPDYVLETLPYYISNPTYLSREHRFGNIVHFTNSATLTLSLEDLLNEAMQLHAKTGKPIVILLADRINPAQPPQYIREAYDWQFTTTPEQVRRFQASTKLLTSFGPVSGNDETYDVYALN